MTDPIPAAPPTAASPAPFASRGMRKVLLAVVQVLVVALLGYFLYGKVQADSAALQKEFSHAHYGWLATGGVLYLLSLAPCGIFWHLILRTVGAEVSLFDVMRAYYIGQLGKYVPSKALVVVIRVWMLRGVAKVGLASACVVYETFAMMAVGALLGVVLLVAATTAHPVIIGASLGVACLVGLPLYPPLFAWLAHRVGIGKSHPEAIDRVARFNMLHWGAGLVGVACGWAVQGIALWCILRGLTPDEYDLPGRWALCTAATSLSVVLGFASLLPGGAGVREWALLELLRGPLGSEPLALAATIAFRLIQILSEIVLSALVWLSFFLVPGPERREMLEQQAAAKKTV